ncbi:hypothetical protein [Bradyrhizobium liaoningense]|uniref:hypothetical protein n=1 Tax=Bradyrhizobium liaoningense TaxID=43992 RepID=UPI001BA67623|nr:hypothetical protein [Bradyrhizobium liaoningense]MBR0712721.1 hypothetical protein [Bradyrhizobium liaoningense]
MLLAISPASAIAGDAKPQSSDSIACAGAATAEYLKADAELVLRATAKGVMSVEDKIAQRRLVEGYCIRWSSCTVIDVPANARELAYRSMFSACLEADASERKAGE